MAELATGNRDDALELVQEAMFKLVRRYARRPEGEWPALFHRILQHTIRDWARRRRVRFRWLSWWSDSGSEETQHAPEPEFADPAGRDPETRVAQEDAMSTLMAELQALPLRQQQAFLLRVWEGLDVAQTACAMGCSQGSVKTHLARAMGRLRGVLEAHR